MVGRETLESYNECEGFTLAPVILIASLCCDAAASASGPTVDFKGRIAAYRPAERMQAISSVANRELLLFQAADARRDLLKIVYVHQGFSDLKGDVLSGAQEISVSVRRDASCDQTLGAFEEEAPSISLQGGEVGTDVSTERVAFASSVFHPPESYRMRCYVLTRWK